MPTYDYRCQSCGERIEAFQRMSDAPLVLCPVCGKESLTRIVSGGAGVIYRGEGWYVTDYSKKSSGGRETSAIPATKSEAKAADAATVTPTTAPTETKSSAPESD